MKLLLSTLALVCSASALAAPQTFVTDNNHTFERFSYNHLGFSTQQSRFNTTTGTVVLDSEAKTGSVNVTIDMKSVDTGSKLFNQHIQGPDFLDTTHYPTATFKSTAVHFDGGNPVSVEGNLTIKGVTRPVTLAITSFKHAMHPMMKRDAIGANATTTVKRSDFNAGKYAPLVGDDVTIDISIEAQEK
jgi:polyisoprenoid-binding protein YceI